MKYLSINYHTMSPQEQADEIYYKYSEFDELTSAEIQKCCFIAIDAILKSVDTELRAYWRMVRDIIKLRG